MMRDKQAIAAVAPPTLQKRLEVIEAMCTLAAQEDEQVRHRQEEIAAVRRDFDALRRDWRLLAPTLRQTCRDQALADAYAELRRYNPDQPRVPAGNPDGGQWTNLDAGRNATIAARSRRNQAECDEQRKKDEFICRSVRTPLCWAQAMERYAACLAGRPIPPLNF